MIDQALLDQLKPACARILRASDRVPCGTGYLVGRKLVATCHHVVAKVLDRPLLCRFGDFEVFERAARVLRWDGLRDTALLEIEDPDAGKPLPADPVATAPMGAPPAEWYAYGFPGFAEQLGIPLDGRVLDARTADKEGRPALCLWVQQFTGDLPASVGGLSGTPVLAGRRLLGQLFRVLGADDGWQRPRLALCYATPAWAVAALMAATGSGDVRAQVAPPQGTPAPVAPPTAAEIADRMHRYESGADVLAEMQAAGNPVAVRGALARWDEAGLPREQGILLAGEILVGMAAADDAIQVLEPLADTARGRQLCALAFSVKGDHARAQALLRQLPASEETAGITGGILKRRWLQEGKRSWLVASHETYRIQNEKQPSPYLAVNVAALALQLGEGEESRREAERARSLAVTAPELTRTHWDWASLAEAELLLGDFDKARLHYRRAAAKAAESGLARDIAVMRRQARLDLGKLGRPRGALDDVLPVGGVACVIGAPLDDAAWTAPRVAGLRERIAALLRGRQVLYGFGSAARGADLLFAEAVLDVGGTPTVFLPEPRDAFSAAWVGTRWRDRFQRVPVERMQVVRPPPDEQPFSACDAEAGRAAVEMGKRLDESPLLVAVLPRPGVPDPRGVREAVERWKERAWGDVEEVSVP